MKTNIVLFLILVLGAILMLGAATLWHLSSTTEFSRTDAPGAPATQGR
ncbi:MAG: hypothetical protein ACNA8L_00210 [Luteolibacter sp.]|jgi:hypothetical protein